MVVTTVNPYEIAPGYVNTLQNVTHRLPTDEDWSMDRVLKDAGVVAGFVGGASPFLQPRNVPDYEWWVKLVDACKKKRGSSYGMWHLRRKVVHFLGQRLACEEQFKANRGAIFGEVDSISASGTSSTHAVEKPIFIVGFPRSQGHMAAHMLGRSGFVVSPTMKDTTFPGTLNSGARSSNYASEMRFHQFNFPQTRVLRNVIGPDMPDDDIALQLMVPYSFAWGLLHGLDEFLMDSIQVSQAGVYEHIRKVLLLFQWYKRCGHFRDNVSLEVTPLDNIVQIQREGPKATLTEQPWVVHSPLAILSMPELHASFGDMRILWFHRGISASIASLCSSIAVHQSIYTGTAPTETQLARIGEKVCGMFGSGSEAAVEYMASFPRDRMLHMAQIDFNRHATRMILHTLHYFGFPYTDRFRKQQTISGQVEYQSAANISRPHHECRLGFFGLHEGLIHEVFSGYIHQFEPFAFYDTVGIQQSQHGSLERLSDATSRDVAKALSGTDGTQASGYTGVGPGARDTPSLTGQTL